MSLQTIEQLKAARAARDLTRAQLADLSGVSSETIKRLEKGIGAIKAHTSTVAALQTALESIGVHFIPEDTNGAGVRFKRET